MRCGKVHKLLSARLDGELSSGMAQRVEEHLKGCAACRKEEQDLVAMRNLFAAKARVDTDDFFWTRLEARIHANEARPRIFDFSKAAVRFAAVSLGILALVAAIYVATSQTEEPPQTYTAPGSRVAAPFESQTILFANDEKEIPDDVLLRLAIEPQGKAPQAKTAPVRPARTSKGAVKKGASR